MNTQPTASPAIQIDLANCGGNMIRYLRKHYRNHNPQIIIRPMRGNMQCLTDATLAHWLRLTVEETDTQECRLRDYRPYGGKVVLLDGGDVGKAA